MREALDLVYKHNLCTYYLLPLIGLNKFSFGVDINFKNCYATSDGAELHVEVEFILERLQHIPKIRTYHKDDSCYYVFSLPSKWLPDFERYRNGQYLKFSPEAKSMIFQQSGLRFKQLNENNRLTTDTRLLAIDDSLERRNILRTKLIEYYGVFIEDSAELLSPPLSSSFIDINQSLTAR